MKTKEDLELEQLEKEFENKLKGTNVPKSNYVPYKSFIKKLESKTKNIVDDKVIKELEKDLIREQKKDHKNLFKEVKKLYKQIGFTNLYKQLKRTENQVKQSEIHTKNTKKQKNINAFYESKYNLKLVEKSSYKMKNKLGELFNFEPTVTLNVNSQTLNIIAKAIYDNYINIQSKFKHLYKQGFESAIKLSFQNGLENDQLMSITLRTPNFTVDYIKKQITEKVLEKYMGGDSDFTAIFRFTTYFIFPLSKKGGCASCSKVVDKLKYKDRTVKLISPKSSNDNCLFMCFAHFLDIKGNTLRFNEIRKQLNLPNGKIKFTDIDKVAEYFDTGYVLLNQKQEIIGQRKLETKPDVHIVLMNDHYYIAEYVDYFKCQQCGRKLSKKNETHQCSNKMTTYYKKQVCGKREFVDMIDCSDKEKISKDSMIFFDLETFQETVCHIPYACGFSYGNHETVDISYGKNCMDKFISHIEKAENKTICAYNGSGFDFYILINYLKDRKYEIKNLILSNGAVLSFKFGKEGKENKVFDLYRFIMTGLDKACDAYEIKNHKMKFDVLKIKSWELSEQYRHEVEPYLKYDVLGLSELFFKFNDSIYELDQVNITKFVTLSNMAYSLWQKTLTELVEIPDIEKYDFIKKGTFGARCYPNVREFKSKYYDDVINKTMTYEELLNTGEYLYPADVTSLYPASMDQFEYPVGKSRWSENPQTEFKNNYFGFYEITFVCPTDIVVPILPRKTLNGGLEWSLVCGTGVYTNVEITNAISVGYKVNFINKCLVWDKTGNVFKTYIQKYYKVKNDAEAINNEVIRSIAKLMLNAMYGKTLQRAIYDNTTIINNYNDLLNFFRDYDITDISVLSDSKLIMTGTSIYKNEKITKPSQLGAFVLSYSRQIMMNYIKAIDPTLKTHIFTYTDTDSIHILGKHADKLRSLGMIKDKKNASLGFLCNDLKYEGIIFYQKNLAPKTYFYEYVDNKNDVYDKNNGVMKAKGIPKQDKSRPMYDENKNLLCDKKGDIKYEKLLNKNLYDNYKTSDPIQFSGLRRKHKSLTKSDITNGVNHFSIVNNTQTRTFMKSEWSGMNLINNHYYPKGYVFNNI